MAQIISAARRKVKGRGGNYEDLDGHTDPAPQSPPDSLRSESAPHSIYGGDDSNDLLGQEIEMTSVSVVPDDTFTVTQAVNAFGFGKFQVRLSLFTGLCWMADSMEMTILSILSPALHCEWHITRYQQALTTTIVFLGMMLSSTFWGNVSDRYGRKKALTMCAVLLFYYGLLSAFAPNFLWILFLRGLVGFAIGCVPQSVTLYAEFLPTKQRAKCVVLLDCFWALGACFEVLLALLVMPTMGWQWLLALSTTPLLAFACICPWLPESARYHVASGQPDKALETLQKVAKDNGKPMLLGRLVVDDGSMGRRGRLRDLLGPELRRTSLLLWFIWMACAFCYYGVVLMTTELFEASANRCSEDGSLSSQLKPIETCSADCKELTTTDYIDLLWTTLAEFPGIFATIFVIERFGRKRTMAVQFVIFAICIYFLLICSAERSFLTAMLFVARGIIAGVFQAAYVYTPEVYPTPLRAVGVGSCSAMARLGAMVTPYVAQVLLNSSLLLAMTVYGLAALLAAVACFMLPIETKGKEMKESVSGPQLHRPQGNQPIGTATAS
ncbi:Synaptic vesicle 2-related protein [Frankliniella fusca]|uniref:Synaptic vesicle 2-related protein n=1 Tax=Frankliniella fusca TaxID=407009 RepID=A0AAE1LQM5_9NEOP|nr:Synaptic vesicle 2-related protein [Frankliniella fusca]